jgi:hypothetical protein
MTQKREPHITQLYKLLDQYAEDLIEESDSEISRRALDAGIDSKKVAADGRGMLDEIYLQIRKERLQKIQSQKYSSRATVKEFSDAKSAREFILNNQTKHPELFTLAARNGIQMDDAEAIRFANQLSELIEADGSN